MNNITPKPFIQLEDIQTHPEHWIQKFSIIEFKDKKGRVYWTKDYNFIPHWKRYKEAKNWIKETNFPEYDCRIVKNENNVIEIITQNYFGTVIAHEQTITWILRKIHQKIIKEINDKLDFNNEEDLLIKKDLEIILTFTTYEQFFNTYNNEQKLSEYNYIYEKELEELKPTEIKKSKLSGKDLEKQAYDLNRTDLAILWKKQLYFITNVKYSDNWNLFLTITAKKCPLSLSYPTWVNSQGMGTLEQGPVIKTTSDNFEDNQRMHYDFCQDLGIKKIYQGAFTSYQPEFQLFRAQVQTYSGGNRSITWSEQGSARGQEPKQLSIPSDIKLTRFGLLDGLLLGNVWLQYGSILGVMGLAKIPLLGEALAPPLFRKLGQQILDSKVVLTIGPKEMIPETGSFFSRMEEKEEVLFPSNPTFTNWLKNQPHLLDHTTFQFYFFNKISMSANGRFIGIKYDKEKDKFILPYKLFINYAPGNLYYRWEFKYINVKCEVNAQGNFEDWTNPARIMKGFDTKVSVKLVATGGGYANGMSWNSPEQEGGLIQSGDDPSPEQGAQTERLFKSTSKDKKDKSVEPAMFSSDTMDFHYSLGEFFNRLTDPIWFYRVDISELLYNNLCWANNKSPILNLPYQWKELGSWAQKEGFYKWNNVYLENDYQNFWKQRMEQGYLLTSGEDFKNPNLNFSHAGSYLQIGGNAWNIDVAEEEIEEIREPVRGQDATGGDTVVPESTAVYIRKTSYLRNDSSGEDYLNQLIQLISEHMKRDEDSSNWYFWHDRNSGERSIPLPEGNYSYKIKGFNSQNQADNQPGNKAIISLSGTNLTVHVEGEKITRTVKTKPPKQTVSQEIDREKLETEVRDEELEAHEEENREEILKEVGAGQERETTEIEKEPWEQEKENEGEGETEKEKEKEREKERENEKETEKEKERERERERLEAERIEAERKEQERKERENEGEGENE